MRSKSLAMYVGLFMLVMGLLPGCGNNTPKNPVPAVSSLSPDQIVFGGAGFTLTVNGTGFVMDSVVRWDGADRATTFISSTQIDATISAADIATVGTAQVTVFNPKRGGGTSGAVTFNITGHPVPSISSLSPNEIGFGGAEFTLTVNGTGFVAGSVVRWDGADRATTFLSSNTQIEATISAADIATAGTAEVTVFNPTPGGGASGAVTFRIIAVPRFAYVANPGDDTVSSYTVDASTGQLRHTGYVAAGTEAWSVTVDPTGRFAYAANAGSDDVSAYTIDQATGVLTSVGAPIAAGTGPQSVTVDPTGRFTYVANFTSSDVSAYTIDQATGELTSVGAAVAAGSFPFSITVDPSGQFAYVANGVSDDISAYTIDQTTGALTSVGAAVAAGTDPQSVTVDPTGRFTYVANFTSSDVSAYTINATTGALTSVGAAVAAGTSPVSVTVDSTGRFAYVANSGSSDVSVYTIDQTTGALTAVGSAVAAGGGPVSITTTGTIE